MFQIFLIFFSFSIFAGVGKVIKIEGGSDSYLMRGSSRINLLQDMDVEEKDVIYSEDSLVTFLIHPSSQFALSKNTVLRIEQAFLEENQKSILSSVIGLVKGLIRAQVIKDEDFEVDQKIQTENVVFAVRGTEFELSLENEDVDLDVVEGIVEVSSPLIHSFMPEFVRGREGLRFLKDQKKFFRRKFKRKFLSNPYFIERTKLKKIWSIRKNKFKIRSKLKFIERNKKSKSRD